MKKQVLIADADEHFRSDLATALNGSEEFEALAEDVQWQLDKDK